MRGGAARVVGLLVAAVLAATGLGAAAGCGGKGEADGGGRRDGGGDAERLAQRARQVAAAWDGSAAAADWRRGYHPMGEVVRLPRGGLRGKADKEAYRERRFALRGALPASGPESGQVVWDGGGSLARPLARAPESYEALGGSRSGGEPRLTVTGVELGGMSVATSRGPATVPAWLFRLEGYDSPLRQAAAIPSKLPRPPIRRTSAVPGLPLQQVLHIPAGGRSVSVIALHGACDDGSVVTALETGGSVVLAPSVKGRKSAGFCTRQAKSQRVTVELDRPLGDRVLLDALTGGPVPYRPAHGPSPSWS